MQKRQWTRFKAATYLLILLLRAHVKQQVVAVLGARRLAPAKAVVVLAELGDRRTPVDHLGERARIHAVEELLLAEARV